MPGVGVGVPMHLHLVRHAIAAPARDPAVDADAERPLTDEGRQQATDAVAGMRALGVEPDRVATSLYLRARETAEVAAEGLGLPDDAIVELDSLTPQADPAMTRAALAELTGAEEVLVVGHKPHLPRFATKLLTGQVGGFDLAMGTASLCSIDIALGTPEAWGRLERLIPAQTLAALG